MEGGGRRREGEGEEGGIMGRREEESWRVYIYIEGRESRVEG